MSYSLHIERPRGEDPLSLAEWTAAVEASEQMRLGSGDVTIRNPKTWEDITFPGSGADAEVRLESGEWVALFRWSAKRGSVSFNPAGLPEDSALAAARIACRLAASLNASVVGDDGETYDEASLSAAMAASATRRQRKAPKAAKNVVKGPW
jgi:hypothetical protein